jgi:hypothetical protein
MPAIQDGIHVKSGFRSGKSSIQDSIQCILADGQGTSKRKNYPGDHATNCLRMAADHGRVFPRLPVFIMKINVRQKLLCYLPPVDMPESAAAAEPS